MNFDEIIPRVGTHSTKWDLMQARYGVSPEDGIAMWVADMDFRAPDCVRAALKRYNDLGIYGYFGDDSAYRAAIDWWMRTRHGYSVAPESILTTQGLVSAVGLCAQSFSAPGEGVVVFTPVYHAFARVIEAAGRKVVECPLVLRDGAYHMDFDAYDAAMTGTERLVILCSPHNPGGKCWSQEELQGVADFARRHDLILISDEVHQDLVFPGARHIAMPVAVPDIQDRLVMLTAPSKTFNIAGGYTGQMIVPDKALRARLASMMAGLGLAPNSFGLVMTTAAYSPEGAEWVDALMNYLDGNRALFAEGISAIPGLAMMPMQATYLAWVDFAGTGMTPQEFTARVEKDARIAANHGPTFGTGGETWLRFNLATPRARVREAVERLQQAFGDLQ